MSNIAFISLPINLNMCFGCSEEPSHMLWLRNKKYYFPVRTLEACKISLAIMMFARNLHFSSPASLCCVLSKNNNPSLVLVQPRKTRPYITERLLMGRQESNQTKLFIFQN